VIRPHPSEVLRVVGECAGVTPDQVDAMARWIGQAFLPPRENTTPHENKRGKREGVGGPGIEGSSEKEDAPLARIPSSPLQQKLIAGDTVMEEEEEDYVLCASVPVPFEEGPCPSSAAVDRRWVLIYAQLHTGRTLFLLLQPGDDESSSSSPLGAAAEARRSRIDVVGILQALRTGWLSRARTEEEETGEDAMRQDEDDTPFEDLLRPSPDRLDALRTPCAEIGTEVVEAYVRLLLRTRSLSSSSSSSTPTVAIVSPAEYRRTLLSVGGRSNESLPNAQLVFITAHNGNHWKLLVVVAASGGEKGREQQPRLLLWDSHPSARRRPYYTHVCMCPFFWCFLPRLDERRRFPWSQARITNPYRTLYARGCLNNMVVLGRCRQRASRSRGWNGSSASSRLEATTVRARRLPSTTPPPYPSHFSIPSGREEEEEEAWKRSTCCRPSRRCTRIRRPSTGPTLQR
jgi:hypothetical protein